MSDVREQAGDGHEAHPVGSRYRVARLNEQYPYPHQDPVLTALAEQDAKLAAQGLAPRGQGFVSSAESGRPPARTSGSRV